MLNYLRDERGSSEEARRIRRDVCRKGGRVARADGVEQYHHPVVLGRPLQRLEVVVGQTGASRDDDEGVVLCLIGVSVGIVIVVVVWSWWWWWCRNDGGVYMCRCKNPRQGKDII